MKSRFPLPTLARRKRNLPGAELLEAFINLIPDPALLAETRTGQVLLANDPVLELTGFSHPEIENQFLPVIFPDLDWAQIETGSERWARHLAQSVKKRDGTTVEVHITQIDLGPESKWVFLTLEPESLLAEQQAAQQRKDQVWETLRLMAAASQYAEQPDILHNTLQLGSLLLEANLLLIYQVDGENYILKRKTCLGPVETLPDQIHPQDLVSLKAPQIWTPGKRSQSSLHRAARAANLAFLASAPLGQQEALVGLLVIAGEKAPIHEELLPLLTIMAAALTSILQHQSVTSNLQAKIQDYLREAGISTAVRQSVTDGVLLINPDFTIQELNPAAEEMLGYTSREVRLLPYQNMLVGTDNLIPPLITGNPEPNFYDAGNVKLYRRDGQIFQAHVRTQALWINERLETYVMLIRDLSEHEQFQIRNQQLEQQAILGEFSAIFAHEVRNPINNISTGLQVLEENYPEGDPKRDTIGRLKQDCERLNELMKSVLIFSKPMEYKLEPMDVGAALRKVLERWRLQMMRANIQHHIQVDQNVPLAEGDQRALDQVWNNLISNALQAMTPQGGTLTVRVRSATTSDQFQRVEVSVTDTGMGIPEEIRERIFEPFFTTKKTGTGLGLAITKRIVNMHNGTIRVMSIPGGTVFTVQLPVANHN